MSSTPLSALSLHPKERLEYLTVDRQPQPVESKSVFFSALFFLQKSLSAIHAVLLGDAKRQLYPKHRSFQPFLRSLVTIQCTLGAPVAKCDFV